MDRSRIRWFGDGLTVGRAAAIDTAHVGQGVLDTDQASIPWLARDEVARGES